MRKEIIGCKYDPETEKMIKKEGFREDLEKEGFYPVSSSGRCCGLSWLCCNERPSARQASDCCRGYRHEGVYNRHSLREGRE